MGQLYCCSALVFLLAHGSNANKPDKPHLVFIMVDDLGWSNVGWHNEKVLTPHSNALVREGITLDRHYLYVYCSPSRSSFLSGRLPYHVNQINLGPQFPGSGIARNMTTIPRKLKGAGYATHMIGKWHCGMSTPDKSPHGRGFDTSLHYFEGAVDHFSSCNCMDDFCSAPNDGYSNVGNHSAGNRCHGNLADPNATAVSPPITPHHDYGFKGTGATDFWATDKPAKNVSNTDYNGYIFTNEAIKIINAHPAATPLFMYIAMQNNHAPLQVPLEYMERYPAGQYWDQRIMNGMTSFWDEAVGNITGALKTKGLWEDTLLVVAGDNGGPVYWTDIESVYAHGGSANNWPLRGGKAGPFEGGVRVAAFVAGGVIPSSMHGRVLESTDQTIHVCDWYVPCLLIGTYPACS
jgi:arylsulfatase I/J